MLIQQRSSSKAIHQSQPSTYMFSSSMLQMNMGSFHLPLHLPLSHILSINILTVQLWVRKGSSPASLLWNYPMCSYYLALKTEELPSSQNSQQMILSTRGSVLLVTCSQENFPVAGKLSQAAVWTCINIQNRHNPKCHQQYYSLHHCFTFSDYQKFTEPALWSQYHRMGKSD